MASCLVIMIAWALAISKAIIPESFFAYIQNDLG